MSDDQRFKAATGFDDEALRASACNRLVRSATALWSLAIVQSSCDGQRAICKLSLETAMPTKVSDEEGEVDMEKTPFPRTSLADTGYASPGNGSVSGAVRKWRPRLCDDFQESRRYRSATSGQGDSTRFILPWGIYKGQRTQRQRREYIISLRPLSVLRASAVKEKIRKRYIQFPHYLFLTTEKPSSFTTSSEQ